MKDKNRNKCNKLKIVANMEDTNSTVSIINLNVSFLNTLMKRQKLSERIKIHERSTYCL